MNEIPEDIMQVAQKAREEYDLKNDAGSGYRYSFEEVINRAILADRERRHVSEWKPIDSAPKDGTSILLGHSQAAFDGWWDEIENAWVDGETNMYGDLRHYEPTHWKPLPQLPGSDEDQEPYGMMPVFKASER